MSIPGETGAAFRVRAPAVLVRGADSRTRIEPRLADTAVGGAPATYTLLGPTGAVLVNAAVVTPSAGVLAYTVPAASLPSTLDYGMGYREVWTTTVGGVVLTATRPAALARYPLHCPVTQADLLVEYPDLDDMQRSSTTDLQDVIDSAWSEVVRDLYRHNRWPDAMLDVDGLYDVVLHRALARHFRWRSLDAPAESTDSRLMAAHEVRADRAWSEFTTRLDMDGDGVADTDDRVPGVRVLSRGTAEFYDYRRLTWPGRRGRVF